MQPLIRTGLNYFEILHDQGSWRAMEIKLDLASLKELLGGVCSWVAVTRQAELKIRYTSNPTITLRLGGFLRTVPAWSPVQTYVDQASAKDIEEIASSRVVLHQRV